MQHLGLVSLAVYFTVIAYILVKYDVRHTETVSDHVKNVPQRSIFVPITIITNTLLCAHIVLWLFPRVVAHESAYFCIAVAFLAQLWTTFIARDKTYIFTHDSLAVLSGSGMYLALMSLYVSSSINELTASVLLIVLVAMSVIGVSLPFRDRPYYVYNQLAYHLLFSFFIAFVAYQ